MYICNVHTNVPLYMKINVKPNVRYQKTGITNY